MPGFIKVLKNLHRLNTNVLFAIGFYLTGDYQSKFFFSPETSKIARCVILDQSACALLYNHLSNYNKKNIIRRFFRANCHKRVQGLQRIGMIEIAKRIQTHRRPFYTSTPTCTRCTSTNKSKISVENLDLAARPRACFKQNP